LFLNKSHKTDPILAERDIYPFSRHAAPGQILPYVEPETTRLLLTNIFSTTAQKNRLGYFRAGFFIFPISGTCNHENSRSKLRQPPPDFLGASPV
jgi:hypothetical protein